MLLANSVFELAGAIAATYRHVMWKHGEGHVKNCSLLAEKPRRSGRVVRRQMVSGGTNVSPLMGTVNYDVTLNNMKS